MDTFYLAAGVLAFLYVLILFTDPPNSGGAACPSYANFFQENLE